MDMDIGEQLEDFVQGDYARAVYVLYALAEVMYLNGEYLAENTDVDATEIRFWYNRSERVTKFANSMRRHKR